MITFTFDGIVKENTIEHNTNCPQTLDLSYGILNIGSLELEKANVLLNLINHQSNVDKISPSVLKLNQDTVSKV